MKTIREILLYLVVILVGGWLVVFQSARQVGGETAVSAPITSPTAIPESTAATVQMASNPQNMVTCDTSLWVVDKDAAGEPRHTLYCDGELLVFDLTGAMVAVSGIE